jgi:hypothetical protein
LNEGVRQVVGQHEATGTKENNPRKATDSAATNEGHRPEFISSVATTPTNRKKPKKTL